MAKLITGNLIELANQGDFDVIIHGCNCFCTFGAGLALQIKRSFPEAHWADKKTSYGSRLKLGTYSSANIKIRVDGVEQRQLLTVVNAYTQFDYKGSGVRVDYDAIERVFGKIHSDFPGLRIGIPKIGAGLARGDWQRIEGIIAKQLTGDDYTIVEFASPKMSDSDESIGIAP